MLFYNNTAAQELPFYSDIQTFKKQDSAAFPPKNAILFVGSSSFTKWTDVQDYFPGYPIINRGFGGSSLPDLIRYVNDIIIPYHPKQIIIYCGENDVGGSDTTVNGKVVFNRFKQLFILIKKQLPAVAIGYVSMKPSPSREKLWPKMIDGNLLIKAFYMHLTILLALPFFDLTSAFLAIYIDFLIVQFYFFVLV